LEESTFASCSRHDGEPTTISSSLQLLLVSRNLERVADLATNIGEDAVYLAEGSRSSTISRSAKQASGRSRQAT